MNRKKVTFIVVIILIAVVGISIVRGLALYLSVDSHAKYWQNLAKTPASGDTIVLLALGDSTMQGLGALDPLNGPVGKAAECLRRETGRPVKIVNKSKSGGTMRDVVRDQLPSLSNVQPDVVIVSVGANDAKRQRDVKEFKDEAHALLTALPRKYTVITDVSDVKNRAAYQAALERAASSTGIELSPLYETWRSHYKYRPWNYAGDFYHPSARGYQAWQDAWEPRLGQIAAKLEIKR